MDVVEDRVDGDLVVQEGEDVLLLDDLEDVFLDVPVEEVEELFGLHLPKFT